MRFTFMTVISVILIIYAPSVSALPATSHQQGAGALNRAPIDITNIKSNSIAWALEKRSRQNRPTGEGIKRIYRPNTRVKKLPQQAKLNKQPNSNRGTNARTDASVIGPLNRKRLPVNNGKRPNARPPSSYVPTNPQILSANDMKRPNGQIAPTERIEQKPKKAVKPHNWQDSRRGGNKSPIYAMSVGQVKEEGPDGSESEEEE